MKYEISNQQFLDFLNCLTRTQQNTRTFVDISGTSVHEDLDYVLVGTGPKNRHSIQCATTLPASGPITMFLDKNDDDVTGDGEYIALNYLNWEDSKAKTKKVKEIIWRRRLEFSSRSTTSFSLFKRLSR